MDEVWNELELMKQWFSWAFRLFVILSSTIFAFAQQSDRNAIFRWDWHQSQRLHWRQSLSRSKQIKPRDREALTAALVSKFDHCRDPKSCAGATRVKLVDLNGDGVQEVIVQASDNQSCSPTGNCDFWVLKKSARGYEPILERDAIQTFTIQPKRREGFRDLVLGMHGSAFLQELFVYEFHGGRYELTACYDANWSYLDRNGDLHELKEPRVEPCTHDWRHTGAR